MLENAEMNFAEQELHLLNDLKDLKALKIEEEDSHLCQIRSQIKVSKFSNFLSII